MKKSGASEGQSASELISKRIAELGDWRGETLGRMRKLIKEADPDVVEEWKWMGTPIWSHDGIICTGESYKKVVKLTFAKGASLKDPARLFNSSLEGNVRRAIDIHEGEEVDAAAFKALVREAIALNSSQAKPRRKKTGLRAAGPVHLICLDGHIARLAICLLVESSFAIVAEPNRRAILSLLLSSERSVGEIERELRLSQPSVSKHLRVLREAGFVESRIEAQRRLYRLRPEPLMELDAWLVPFRRFWSKHVDALERHLDRMDEGCRPRNARKERRRHEQP